MVTVTGHKDTSDRSQERVRLEDVPWKDTDLLIGLLLLGAFWFVNLMDVILPSLGDSPAVSLAGYLFVAAAPLLVPWYLARRRKAPVSLAAGLRGSVLKEILLAIPYCLGMVVVLSAVILVLGDIGGLPVEPTALDEQLRSLPSHWVLAILLFLTIAVVAPVSEEIFFRGFLHGMFKHRIGRYASGVVQAVLFGTLHTYDPQHMVFGILFGLLLVWVYEARQTLLTPIFVHATLNTLATLPVMALLLLNSHTPAPDMERASILPEWYGSGVWEQMVERQDLAQEQLDYARTTFGREGAGIWKAEVAALEKVGAWHDHAVLTAAEAEVGIIEVMGYELRDPRRGIVLADSLLASRREGYEEYTERALALRSAFQLMIGEYGAARDGFREVLRVLVPRPALEAFCRHGLALASHMLTREESGGERETQKEVRQKVRKWLGDLFKEDSYH